mmetsp:Transcript_3074/g.2968  ORF Transcript_3074/g.2968 Transcript_3074/m.2968 type:complete len:157 (-) Transcript_3074:326-796(-)|eukprot:CAMPEP_0197829282 /NCGR_PEP_ID=MMETSP1437-20131217/5706_1 /TAXON_ID=49252 ORGANISM="Eucampia antarctica, Strain CCMP1452" /NCGR_SAMPLE_ID=MMETSP1437 /ASSEMBLY_ACC=CAM_ASM_001096 /LENGTH=156 /DNA_ID=CAMNT_0043430841 /DNA_START=75 /DNA_END=545 /DNA_ORIENTATION=+
MKSFDAIDAAQGTAVLSLILWSKVAATNLGLGGAKNKAGGRAPEDTYQNKSDDVSEGAKVAQDRAQRIVNNDLENIPYTMVLAWASVFFIYHGRNTDKLAQAHLIFYILFVASRIAHSISYSLGNSYSRSAAWAVGLLCSFAIGIICAIASFRLRE